MIHLTTLLILKTNIIQKKGKWILLRIWHFYQYECEISFCSDSYGGTKEQRCLLEENLGECFCFSCAITTPYLTPCKCILADSNSLSTFSLMLCRFHSSKICSTVMSNYEFCIIPGIKKEDLKDTLPNNMHLWLTLKTSAFLEVFSRTSSNLPDHFTTYKVTFFSQEIIRQLYIKVMMEFRMSEGFTFLSILTLYSLENYFLPSGARHASQFPFSLN